MSMEIRLEKSGDSRSISLDKATSHNDEIVINLNWNREARDGGQAIDLDLGCYWEARPVPHENGFVRWIQSLVNAPSQRGCIDGLQFAHGNGGRRDVVSRQGCYTQLPWVWHAGDDRVGSSAQGENLLLNPGAATHLQRLVIYAFIYEGAPAWSSTDAVVRIAVPSQAPLVLELGKQASTQNFCVLATLDFDGASGINVTRHVSFHGGHADASFHYNWRMNFAAGSK
jgi:tellurite resistance protein TerA